MLATERWNSLATAFVASIFSAGLAAEASAGERPPPTQGPRFHHMTSTPANTVWGGFPIDLPAVLTIQSGDKVRVDALSQTGLTNVNVSPETFYGAFGVEPDEILQEAKDFWASLPTRTRFGPHICTGPLYLDGAEPGDTIEIQILDVYQRVNYGVNNTSPTGGVLGTSYPGWREGDPPLDIPPVPDGPAASSPTYANTSTAPRR